MCLLCKHTDSLRENSCQDPYPFACLCSMKPMLIEDRFWQNVHKTDDCWLWNKSCDHHGYGQFGVYVRGKKVMKRAHRVAWTLTHGPIPDDMCILHTCDTRDCVRPDHLRLATKAENSQDMLSRGRWNVN